MEGKSPTTKLAAIEGHLKNLQCRFILLTDGLIEKQEVTE
jgi:hypothetical protein